MRKTKQFTAFLLALAMLSACAIPTASLSTNAAEAVATEAATEADDSTTTYTGSCGTKATWTYDKSTETLTISGTGTVETYVKNGVNVLTPGWLANGIDYTAKHVVIENGITGVGEGFELYCFGDTTGALSLEVPQTVQSMTLDSLISNENVYFYGKKESWFYYQVYKTDRFVSTGSASYPYIYTPTSGTFDDGVTWSYDSDSRTLTIDGSGTFTSSEYNSIGFDLTADIVIFGKEVQPPTDIDADSDSYYYNTFLWCIISIYKTENGPRVCIYRDSPMGEAYEEMVAFFIDSQGKTRDWVEQKYPITYIDDVPVGDVNLDGQVSLNDCILLSKATSNGVSLNSVQKIAANCYSDDAIDGNDLVTLLKFLVNIIDTLPETAS